MKYLIVGLGNPGPKYATTRHNIGFMALDVWANANALTFENARYGDVGKGKYAGRQIIFLKPNTYMNLSGKALMYWLAVEKIPVQNVLVITDDLALPLGKLRLRAKGSAGGHNGLKDIEAQLQHSNYARLRLGIGSDFSKGQQVDYVLGTFDVNEQPILNTVLQQAVEAIKQFVTQPIDRAMNFVNTEK